MVGNPWFILSPLRRGQMYPHQSSALWAAADSCLAAARSGAALTCHRHVIHSRAPASQPLGKPGKQSFLRWCGEGHPEKQTSVARSIVSGTEAHIPSACSPPRQSPLRFSALGTRVQGDAPAALFPRFLSRERNRAAGGAPSKTAKFISMTVCPMRTQDRP